MQVSSPSLDRVLLFLLRASCPFWIDQDQDFRLPLRPVCLPADVAEGGKKEKKRGEDFFRGHIEWQQRGRKGTL